MEQNAMADEHTDQLPDEPADAPKPIPMLVCRGEGYITRKDGTVIPFTLSNETA